MNYYCMEEDKFHHIYSVDMLRFHVHLHSKDLSPFCSIMNTYDFSKTWHDNGFGKFANNWSFTSLWVGAGTMNQGDYPLICLEFNPNRCTDYEFNLINSLFNLFHYNFKLKRFDLAVDVPFNINDIKFTSLTKKSYSIFYNDFNNKTFYYGKGNGHTKIYNKKLESNLDYELTRFEVTLECDLDFKHLPSYCDFDFHFPCYTPFEFTYPKVSGTDCTLDAIQFSLNNGFPFKSLSRTYRSFFKRTLPTEFCFSNDIANLVLHNTLLSLRCS